MPTLVEGIVAVQFSGSTIVVCGHAGDECRDAYLERELTAVCACVFILGSAYPRSMGLMNQCQWICLS